MSGADQLTEALWSQGIAATTSVPTASAVTITAGWEPITIPAGFFQKLGGRTSSARLSLQGTLTATATVPTFAFGLAWTQAVPAAFNATNLMHAISSTVTPTAGTAFQLWLDWDIFLRTLGSGANSVLVTTGKVRCPSGFATPFELTLPPSNGTKVTSGTLIDVMQPIFLWPYLTLGAATAGNTVTLDSGKLFGDS